MYQFKLYHIPLIKDQANWLTIIKAAQSFLSSSERIAAAAALFLNPSSSFPLSFFPIGNFSKLGLLFPILHCFDFDEQSVIHLRENPVDYFLMKIASSL